MLFIEQTGNTFLSFKFFFCSCFKQKPMVHFYDFYKTEHAVHRYSFTTQIRCEMTIVPNMVEKI